MSWMSTLSETYDNCAGAVGNDKYKTVLLPLSHLTAEAQITVKLDINGNFLGAESIPKGDGTTIIPVTEDSATRSGVDPSPHPLCDKLIYIAGDYGLYVKEKADKSSKFHSKYMNLLNQWRESEYSTEKVEAIYNYLSKNRVIQDLISAKIFVCDSNGLLDSKVKIEKTAQSDCFVRFMVSNPEENCYISETWLDKKLFDSFIKFNMNFANDKNICYITGEKRPISVKHPAKIRNTDDKSKIISSNNEKSFVFHGRFLDANEAVTIGYDTTQKAHNALRWLIGNQGYKNGSTSIVTWSVKGKDLPNILENSENVFKDLPDSEEVIDTGEKFAQRVNKAIAGYKQDLDTNDKIVIMSVDTADGSKNGRLAIKYYMEFLGSIYFDNIRAWYEKCNWEIVGTKEKPTCVITPIPKEIAYAAYGTERDKSLNVDAKIQKACIDRVLPCIVEGKPFPRDLVKLAVQNVSRAMAFGNYNHYKLIGITCAIIKAYYKDKGVEVTMDLNSSNDRSYLFGRLLAVADILEQRTFEKDERDRATNAKRYWCAFSKNPAKTWKIIMERLQPYMDKQSKYMAYYNKLFEEIHSKFESDDYSDKELTSQYVLGYWCQRKEMNTKKINNEEEN